MLVLPDIHQIYDVRRPTQQKKCGITSQVLIRGGRRVWSEECV